MIVKESKIIKRTDFKRNKSTNDISLKIKKRQNKQIRRSVMLPRKSVKKSPMQRFLNSPTKLFEEEKRLSFGAEDSNSLDKTVRLEASFRIHFEDSKKV